MCPGFRDLSSSAYLSQSIESIWKSWGSSQQKLTGYKRWIATFHFSYKYMFSSTNNVLSVLLPVSALPGAMPGSSSWLQHASNEWEDCMVEAAVPAHWTANGATEGAGVSPGYLPGEVSGEKVQPHCPRADRVWDPTLPALGGHCWDWTKELAGDLVEYVY